MTALDEGAYDRDRRARTTFQQRQQTPRRTRVRAWLNLLGEAWTVDEQDIQPGKTEVPQPQPAQGVDPEAALNLALLDAMYHRTLLGHAVAQQDTEAAVAAATAAMGLVLTALCTAYRLVAESPPDAPVRRRVRHMLPGMHRSRAALVAEINSLVPQLAAAHPREVLEWVRHALLLVGDVQAKPA